MFRRNLHYLAIITIAFLPTLAYEGLQKSEEILGSASWAHTLSARAENGTPWNPQTGSSLVDHTLHELQESSLFYRLASLSLLRHLR